MSNSLDVIPAARRLIDDDSLPEEIRATLVAAFGDRIVNDARVNTTRRMLAARGLRLLQRRRGRDEYWVMTGEPMTIAQIEGRLWRRW